MEIGSLQNGVIRGVGLLVVVVALGAGILVVKPKKTYAQTAGSPVTRTAFGLETTTFRTDKGTIEWNFPDDVTAGDTISGTVRTHPAGEDADRDKNESELNGYVLQTPTGRTRVGSKKVKWLIPATVTPGVVYLILRDPRGKEVARAPVPVRAIPAPGTPSSVPPATLQIPTVSQAGQPLQIPGPFDGNASTTAVTIGGKDAPVLAESPRKSIVETPASVVGSAPIHVKKGAMEASGTIRNVRVAARATSTDLNSGETATMMVGITGLSGLKSTIPLQISNNSSGIVRMDGGDRQVVIIQPQDVRPGGSYALMRTLTGIQPGPFNIMTVVEDPELFPPPCTLVRPPTPIAGGNCPHQCKGGDRKPANLLTVTAVPKDVGLPVSVEKEIETAKSSNSALNGLTLFEVLSLIAEGFEGSAVPDPTGSAVIKEVKLLKEVLHKQAAQKMNQLDLQVKITFTCSNCKEELCHSWLTRWCYSASDSIEKQQTWEEGNVMTADVPPLPGRVSTLDPGKWAGGTFDPSSPIVAKAIMDAMASACKKQ